MKKCTLLMGLAMFCGYADGCRAADSCSREEEFLESIGGITPDDNTGCYHDDSSCKYTESNGEEAIYWDYNGKPVNCDDYTYACIYTSNTAVTEGWAGIASCCSCNPGYELKWTSVSSTACASSWEYYQNQSSSSENIKFGTGSGLSGSRYICTQNCQDSNCASDTSWVKVAPNSPYESMTVRTCSEYGTRGICNISAKYRCAENYYGSSTDGETGCKQCPQWSGVYADEKMTVNVVGKSNAGATNITGCFVKQNVYHDSIGTFETDGDCIGR
ncbi:MAG: hypothetical protein K2M34_02780 [Alphaproteobacteria bacterium]|nr:hypothetical protein [Alphaproteobacteria bacterium]